MTFIGDAKLMTEILDYINLTAGPNHLDLIERINNEVESNESKPEDYGIKPLIYNQTDPEDFTNGN